MKLSIITITKNDPAGLLDTLISTKRLLASDNRIEQIVIDGSDHPTQNTNHKTIAKYLPKVIHLPADREGISNSFNQGLAIAKGDWVWFLNGGDTVCNKTPVELLMQILANSSANAVIFEIFGKKSQTVRHHPPLWLRWPLIDNWIPHPATIVRRQLIKKLGAFTPRLNIAMDFDLWNRLFASSGSVDTISIPLVIYDENGISSRNIAQASKENLICLYKYSLKNMVLTFKAIVFNIRNLYSYIINALKINL